MARSDHLRLTDELIAMRAKLNTVKLAFADKSVKFFEILRSNQLVTAKQPVKSPVSIPNAILAQTDVIACPPCH